MNVGCAHSFRGTARLASTYTPHSKIRRSNERGCEHHGVLSEVRKKKSKERNATYTSHQSDTETSYNCCGETRSRAEGTRRRERASQSSGTEAGRGRPHPLQAMMCS